MSKMKAGDFVKGINPDRYGITNDKMTRAVVLDVMGEDIKIKVLEHEENAAYTGVVESEYFEVIGHQKPFERSEVLALLQGGCKKAILDYDLSGANLRGADLCGANLRGADLREADLREADLREADLSGANLRGANLRRADLSGANLSGANLREADLREADLREGDLCGANLSGANLRGANLRGADLRGADLDFSCWPLWCGGLRVKTDKRHACQLAYHLCTMQCDDAEYIAMRNSILGFANQFHRVEECGRLAPIESEL